MDFNPHKNLVGQHAFLSASSYYWLNYDDEKLINTWRNQQAKERGTRLHALAEQLIREGLELKGSRKTISMFVNDAIGFRMTPEQPLVYSENCFGTADAIWFGKPRNSDRYLLRIHDLKTGETPASMHQLEIYAALFYLEYGYDPHKTQTILRIYQSNEVIEFEPDAEEVIVPIMNRIVHFDEVLKKEKEAVRHGYS